MDDEIRTFGLRKNHRVSTPHRLFCYDTETKSEGGTEMLRLWKAVLVLRHGRQDKRDRETFYGGKTVTELVNVIEEESRKSDTLWVFSHNANFDLAVTQLPLILCDRGWQITKNALFSGSPWAFLSKGTHKIRLLDSFSYFPTTVKQLGRMVAVEKKPLPGAGDSDASWEARCANDALIIARALTEAMDWWDANQLGNWSVTGPSTGWNAMLHMPRPAQTVIQQDNKARKWERGSVSGGRREAFRMGRLSEGLYVNLDFVSAHATICAAKHLPRKRIRKFRHLPLNASELRLPDYDIIADCLIQESNKEYAVKTEYGVLYPAGNFRTRICGPEIREGIKNGTVKSIEEGYLYKTGPTMQTWGEWILNLLKKGTEDVPNVVHAMAKGWSRSVPGKWAGRTSRVISDLPCSVSGWHVEDGFLHPNNTPCTTITMGGHQIILIQDQEADDSFPAVLSFIQSWCRLELFHVLEYFQPYVVQCNTDGCVVDIKSYINSHYPESKSENWSENHYREKCNEIIENNKWRWAPLTLRPKKYFHFVTILGAQHTILGADKKLAGIPKSAKYLGDSKFEFEAWPSLKSQVRKEGNKGYIIEKRLADLKHVGINRWRTDGEETIPVTMTLNEMEENEIVIPGEAFHNGAGILPARYQNEGLAKVMRSSGMV